jgi:hypothetical protein
MKAEKTYALASAVPAASKMLLGCQSIDNTVDLIGFLTCLDTHQLFSSSKEQTAIVLHRLADLIHPKGCAAYLAPLPTANLSSFGLHLTQVAARLILSKTSAGFHPFSVGVQTYAFLSWEQVTIRLVWGAQEIAVMSLSCCLSASLDQVLTSANAWTKLQPSWLLL